MKNIIFLLAFLVTTLSNAQIDEGFDDITTLTDYLFINSSDNPWYPIYQGEAFDAFEGNPDSFIAYDSFMTSGSILDHYLITPKLLIENGDVITFYTRALDTQFADRLEVRIGDGTGIFPTEGVPNNVGSFTNLLLAINPNLEIGGYPITWEQQVITISGLSLPTETRVAFRYWVTNGDTIGIDSLTIDSNIVLSTEEVTINDFFKFYNTENDELHLKAANSFKAIQVYNLLGQEVLNKNLSSNEEAIDFSTISNGTYVVNILSNNGATKNFKLIKL